MNREQAIPYVGHVVDDALNGRPVGTDIHAIVRKARSEFMPSDPIDLPYCYPSRLIGWQCGAEPMFVAVHSYLDVRIDDDEATELATDYLDEIGWFANGPVPPDYVL